MPVLRARGFLYLTVLLLLFGCNVERKSGSVAVNPGSVPNATAFRVDVYSQDENRETVEGKGVKAGQSVTLDDVPEGRWAVLVQAQNGDGTTVAHYLAQIRVNPDQTTVVEAVNYLPGLPGNTAGAGFQLETFSSGDQLTLVGVYRPDADQAGTADVTFDLEQGEGQTTASPPTRRRQSSPAQVHPCLPFELRQNEGKAVREYRHRGRLQTRARFEEIPVGGTQDFFVATSFQTVTCQRILADSETQHCLVFAEVVGGSPVLSENDARAIADAFDRENPFLPGQGIYDRTRSIFGSEWSEGGGRDGDPKIVLVFVSSNSLGSAGIFGFFRPSDELPASQVGTSNEGEIIFLNAERVEGDYFDILGTLAHEFLHLINFNQKVAQQGAFPEGATLEQITIDEGMAILSEELNGFTLEAGGGGNNFMYRCVEGYLSEGTSTPFFAFAGAFDDYGAGYLFCRYLKDRFGVDTIGRIVQSTGIGRTNIASVLDQPFETVFIDWATANVANELGGEVPASLRYNNLSLRGTFSIRELGNVQLPGISPNRTQTLPGTASFVSTLESWAPFYLRVDGGDGSPATLGLTSSRSVDGSLLIESPAGTFSSRQ